MLPALNLNNTESCITWFNLIRFVHRTVETLILVLMTILKETEQRYDYEQDFYSLHVSKSGNDYVVMIWWRG